MIRSAGRRGGAAADDDARARVLHAAVFLAALILTAIAWWPSIDGWFLLDDYRWLPPERRRFDLLKSLVGPWGHSFAYRPITRLSFFMDWQLFGLDPRGWHLHSLALQALNGTLLFSLVRVTTGLWPPAIAIAALFLVSPLAHENVAWISGRTFLLGGAFFLLSANLLVRSVLTADTAHGTRLFRWGAAAFVASMASYEAGVVLPLVAFAAVRAFPSLPVVPADVVRSRLRQLFAILIVFMACRFVFMKFRLGGVNPTSPLWLYEPIRWWYGVWIRSGNTIRVAAIVCLALAFVVSCAWLWLRRRKDGADPHLPLFLVVTAFLLFLPFINIVGISDRFLYLVQVTFIATIVLPLWLLARGSRAGAVVAAGAIAALTIAGAIESRRAARDWVGAGLVARSVADELKRLHPQWPAGADVVLDDVPRAVGRTPVYVLYTRDAVLQRYERDTALPDVQVYFGEDLAASAELRAARAGRPARYFRFDAQTRRLAELSANEWESAHAPGAR